jgi:adenosylcobinamide-GDP ribazoletransferase
VADGPVVPAGGVLTSFLGALQFLTRIPVRLPTAPNLARSVPWFPVVGSLIGAATGGVAALSMEWLSPAVAAALAVIVGLMVTGAFHEDGLADTMDALGGTSRERRLEILKDSRHGTYGVAAMCSSIVLRVLCIAAVGPAAAVAGLVAAHTLGRGAAVAVMVAAPPAAADGIGADVARSASKAGAAAGIAAGVAIVVAVCGWWVLPLVGAAVIAAAAIAELGRRAFGGVSGDVLGAVEQVVECAVLVVIVGLAARHRIWWQ